MYDQYLSCPCGRGDYELCQNCSSPICSVHGSTQPPPPPFEPLSRYRVLRPEPSPEQQAAAMFSFMEQMVRSRGGEEDYGGTLLRRTAWKTNAVCSRHGHLPEVEGQLSQWMTVCQGAIRHVREEEEAGNPGCEVAVTHWDGAVYARPPQEEEEREDAAGLGD